MSDGRLDSHQRAVQSPSWYSHESCATPLFDVSWGHQAHQQMQQRQQPQQQVSTPKQDDALCDFFADPDFKAWIANTICTPPRPPRASNFDPLASPASPGNWMLQLGCNTPFSPAKAAFEMQSRSQQPQPQGYIAAPELLRNMAAQTGCSSMPDPRMASAASQTSDILMRSSSVNCPLPPPLSDSPMLCQTPMQQPRTMSGSFAELGDFVASSTTRPTAAVNALHGSQPAYDPRATAMRRASNRVPKRSLEPDFDMTQPDCKGRAARRGPIGVSKSRKPSFQGTGAVMPHNTAGVMKGTKVASTTAGSSGGSLCGLMSPFSLLKPSGSNGQTSLAELNKRIQEKADRPQPAFSTDTSDAGSSGQAGSITMNRLAKGVPVGSSPTIH